MAGIVLAWVVYDVLCRTLGQRSQAALAVVGTGLVALAAWGAGELFAARAAYLQVGVMLGTIMAANVFFVIIPAHRKLVAAMEEGREPDPAPLLEAKNRSVHNNYLTLPVLFTMLAGHFAFVFGSEPGVARLRRDRGSHRAHPRVLQPLARGPARVVDPGPRRRGRRRVSLSGSSRRRPLPASGPTATFAQIQPIVQQRCAPCHSGASAPLGIRFETQEQIEAHARRHRAAGRADEGRCRRATRPGSPTPSARCSAHGSAVAGR